MAILNDLGFGFDLRSCALTGATEGLAFVSPKTGRAASAEAGAPYADRLLKLPPFLLGDDGTEPPAADLLAGFRLTGFFLDRHVFGPRSTSAPEARSALVRDLEKRIEG
jgi:DNA repair protein RecO (recombination protein O)